MSVQEILLLAISGIAVLMDFLWERISNLLIALSMVTGFVFWIFSHGSAGVLYFLPGFLLPIFCFLPLFHFRMIGGGDVKLLSVLGGILGYPKVLELLLFSFLTGGILSAAFLISTGNLKERISYFFHYFYEYLKTGNEKNYRKRNGTGKFPFHCPYFYGDYFIHRRLLLKKDMIAVCDSEAGYAGNFAEYLNARKKLPFRAEAFTDSEKLCQYAGKTALNFF